VSGFLKMYRPAVRSEVTANRTSGTVVA
jgi:hypothetical protein